MDIKQIRQRNLIAILDEKFDGKPAELSRALGQTTSSQISRYLSTKPDTYRPIGDNMARQIETAANKPSGWLDRLHDSVAEDGASYAVESPEDLAEEKAISFADKFERLLEIQLSSADKRELFKRVKERYLREITEGRKIPKSEEEMKAEVIDFIEISKKMRD